MRACLKTPRASQDGFFLIEAMVALLIFALGILGLVAMGGTAVSAQSDAQYRTDASSLSDAIASQIALGINRAGADEATRAANKAASLQTYAYNVAGANCSFSGGWVGAPDPAVQTLLARGLSQMPGATAAYQQIIVDAPGSFNRVEITLCWKTASDNVARRHTVVTYVN